MNLNKKLLLGLSTVSLTTLPVLTVISCTPTPKPNPDLIDFEAELNKIKDGTTTSPNTTQEVLNEIKSTGNNLPQKSAIIKRYIDLTNLSNGFEVVYDDAVISISNSTSLKITFHLTKDNKSSLTKTITISNFKFDFTTELNKITDGVSTIAITVQQILDNITGASSIPAKSTIIKEYMDLAHLTPGIEVIYVDATNSTINPTTSLAITFKLEKGGVYSSNKTITITGFQPDVTDMFDYTIVDGKSITIKRFKVGITHPYNLVIPSELSVEGTIYPVTAIDHSAFQSADLVSVFIPSSIETIGFSAFNNNWITSLIFEKDSKIITIGDAAFFGNKLTDPNSIKNLPSIIDNPFDKFRIDLPDFSSTFRFFPTGSDSTGKPTAITIRGLQNWITTTNLVIPASIPWEGGKLLPITAIDGGGVFENKNLTSLDLSQSTYLQEIGYGAFANNKLTNVNIPSSVITIQGFAFDSNELKALTFESGSKLKTINETAFQNNLLSAISLPNSITTIGPWAFTQNRLTNLVIPSSVTTIGELAFHSQNDYTGAKFLTSLSFEKGSKLISIGGMAFSNNALTSLDLSANTFLTTIGIDAFDSNNLTTIKIPNSVTTIGDGAFRRNKFSNLSEIIIPTEFNSTSERSRIGIIIYRRY